MMRILIKKTILDIYENLIPIVILNIGFICFVLVGLFIPRVLSFHIVSQLSGFLIMTQIINIYLGFAYNLMGEYVKRKNTSINIKKIIYKSLYSGFTFGGLVFLCILSFTIAVSFYSSALGILGLPFLVLVLCVSVLFLFGLQYYYAYCYRLDYSCKKAGIHSIILFFKEPSISIIIAILILVILTLSLLTGLIFPGIASICILHHNTLEFLRRKQKYITRQEHKTNSQIPWTALFPDVLEELNHCTIRNILWPWKE